MRRSDELPEDEWKPNHHLETPWNEAQFRAAEGYDEGDEEAKPLEALSRRPAPGAMRKRPETEMQALMETAPGEAQALSGDQRSTVEFEVANSLAGLTPRQRYVVEAVVYEKASRRELARRLGLSKTQVDRIWHQARKQLAEELQWIQGDNQQ